MRKVEINAHYGTLMYLSQEEASMVHYVSYKAPLVVIGGTSYVLLSPECTSTIMDASELNVEG